MSKHYIAIDTRTNTPSLVAAKNDREMEKHLIAKNKEINQWFNPFGDPYVIVSLGCSFSSAAKARKYIDDGSCVKNLEAQNLIASMA